MNKRPIVDQIADLRDAARQRGDVELDGLCCRALSADWEAIDTLLRSGILREQPAALQ